MQQIEGSDPLFASGIPQEVGDLDLSTHFSQLFFVFTKIKPDSDIFLKSKIR